MIFEKDFRVKRKILMPYLRGKSVANQFVIYRLENQATTFSVGLSVSKKLGNAVTRNQIRRNSSCFD